MFSKTRRRLILLTLTLPVLALVSAVVYMVGMEHLEEDSRSFLESIQWAVETLTTTGYGDDGRWAHPVMAVFVMVVQFVGVFLVFLVFPIYLIPFLEERFETRLPRAAPGLRDHVLIYGSGPAVSMLLQELEDAGVTALVVEEDEVEARRLLEHRQQVICRTLEDDSLESANLGQARALIVNSEDERNAIVVLSARQLGFQGEILALVEEPLHRQPMILAGASAAYTPRHILGAALAAQASRRISPWVSGFEQLGERLQVGEVRIAQESSLAGQTLGEARIGAATGVTVIGQWVQGQLISQPGPQMRLAPRGLLIVAGTREGIERLTELVAVGATPPSGPFLIGGYGEVGKKVTQLLRDVGEAVRVIDIEPGEGIDHAGDVLRVDVLSDAGFPEAQALILALDSDSATLFATVIARDLAPRVPIIARVNRVENVERILRAGADFALSISQVSGRVLTRRLLGQDAIPVDPQLKVLRSTGAALGEVSLGELDIRTRTGCSVIAVERDGQVLSELGAGFRFQPDDAVFVCGSNSAVQLYSSTYS